jgi:UDP-N-acetylmuramoyl-tripeptide--D-alanyl-D-alanine ligase
MIKHLTIDDIVTVTGGSLTASAIEARLEKATNGATDEGELAFSTVTTDSRNVHAGSLFVALVGEKFDGHDYLGTAKTAGAAAAIVSREVANADIAQILVEDTLTALGQIANATRLGFPGPVVGITGSVGKTTTKEFLALVLETTYAVEKTPANLNNEIGLPLTILGTSDQKTALVLEMGMRGLGQIAYLSVIAEPTIAVITNIGVSHIELLGSRENIAEAKGELLIDLPEDGLAVFPATDDFAATLRAKTKAKVLTVAIEVGAEADIKATELSLHENGWRATVHTPWGVTKLLVPSPGKFNVQNALLAIAVGGHLGIPLDAMARAIGRFQPPKMRLEILKTPTGVTVLSDAYNAAPDSMVGALMTLFDTPTTGTGQKIAVLGEMRELGEFAAEAHKQVGYAVAKVKPDMLVLVGTETKSLSAGAIMEGFPPDKVHYFDTTSQAAELLPMIVQSGDVVLIKGSRALELERVASALMGSVA